MVLFPIAVGRKSPAAHQKKIFVILISRRPFALRKVLTTSIFVFDIIPQRTHTLPSASILAFGHTMLQCFLCTFSPFF